MNSNNTILFKLLMFIQLTKFIKPEIMNNNIRQPHNIYNSSNKPELEFGIPFFFFDIIENFSYGIPNFILTLLEILLLFIFFCILHFAFCILHFAFCSMSLQFAFFVLFCCCFECKNLNTGFFVA